MQDDTKPHKLEDLKNKLFSKNYRPHAEHRDEFSRGFSSGVPDSWQPAGESDHWENKFFMKTSLFKKIFIVSLAFFVLAVGYAFYVFFAGSNTVSNENIEITVKGNNFAAGGEELELIVGIVNRNSTPLELADLVVEYPRGTATGLGSNMERRRESLGTIPAGSSRNENLKLILFGEQGSQKPIRIILEYRVPGSNAIFLKEKIHNVNISSTPINLSIEGPLSVSSNQEISLSIKTSLNATRPAGNIAVKVEYPLGFQFVKAVPEPSFSNNIWYLGDLQPGAEHGITLTGRMIDVFDGEEKTFNISAGSQLPTDKTNIEVVFNSARHTLAIKKPFIETGIFINGVSRREYSVNSKNPINVEIRYANNLSTQVEDVKIEAKISGNAWNRSSVRATQGYYDSATNTITWDRISQQSLREVNSGDSDSVSFSVTPVPLYSPSGELLGSPIINIDVNVYGRQAGGDATLSQIKSSTSATLRVSSEVGFTAKALYYSGPFKNTGPIPPKAEEETTYTIAWTLSNSSNSISQAKIISTLPSWVDFAGTVSPAGEDVAYNSADRSVTWNIGRIPKGTGITTAARTVYFQVTLKPSLSQVGSSPSLVNEAVLTGRDDFANVEIRASKSGLTTRLDNDPAFPPNGALVTQ